MLESIHALWFVLGVVVGLAIVALALLARTVALSERRAQPSTSVHQERAACAAVRAGGRVDVAPVRRPIDKGERAELP